MSQQAVDEILQKASSDPAFRSRLQSDLEGAVRGYDISDEEKGQLQSAAREASMEAAPESQAAALAATDAQSSTAEASNVNAQNYTD